MTDNKVIDKVHEKRVLTAIIKYSKSLKRNIEGFIESVRSSTRDGDDLKEYIDNEKSNIDDNKTLIAGQLKRISRIENLDEDGIQLLEDVKKLDTSWKSITQIVELLKSANNDRDSILKCFELYSNRWTLNFKDFENATTILNKL